MRYLPLTVALLAVWGLWGTKQLVADVGPDPAKGPDQVVLQATMGQEKVAKPAYLPHRAHQWLECDACHHGQGPSGKKAEWKRDQPVQTCETCHNRQAGMVEPLATLKRAGHSLCLECHLRQNKDLAKCSVCHMKQDFSPTKR